MNNSHKSFDSKFCGSLPLHLINQIQPHGVLLILDKVSFNIVQVSDNSSSYLGLAPEILLNTSLKDLIDPGDFDNLIKKLETWPLKNRISINLSFVHSEKPIEFIAFLNPGENYIQMELEYMDPDKHALHEVFHEVNFIIASLKSAPDFSGLAHIAAVETKKLSGFDKVMIYKFDDKWNGTVIAEAKEEGMDSYLHLRFPASDIPKQARDLYFKIPLRAIPDVDFKPSSLIPVVNPLSKSFTDLSESNLRSVPAVHIEYLKNMNIKASFSIPLIVNNELWGLVSFHHRTPKFLTYGLRIAFELLSSFISMQLAARELEQATKLRMQLHEISLTLISQIIKESSLITPLFGRSPNIMDLLNLSGAAVKWNGKFQLLGETPHKSDIEDIIDRVNLVEDNSVFATDNLSSIVYGGSSFKEIASGLIVIPLSPKNREYILGFRQEVIQKVTWGGNPNEAINFEADRKIYHPRSSFERYKETVEGMSEPWLKEEIEAAEALKTAILEQIIKEKT